MIMSILAYFTAPELKWRDAAPGVLVTDEYTIIVSPYDRTWLGLPIVTVHGLTFNSVRAAKNWCRIDAHIRKG